jgi:hypothetical protein
MSALGPEPQTKRKCLAKATAHGSRAGSKFETGVSGAAGRLSSTSSTILCVCVGGGGGGGGGGAGGGFFCF